MFCLIQRGRPKYSGEISDTSKNVKLSYITGAESWLVFPQPPRKKIEPDWTDNFILNVKTTIP